MPAVLAVADRKTSAHVAQHENKASCLPGKRVMRQVQLLAR
jgi:hypothetical protein